MGNSTNKKDAQTNAARDFVNYLVRVGEMSAAEVPAVGVSTLLLVCQLKHTPLEFIEGKSESVVSRWELHVTSLMEEKEEEQMEALETSRPAGLCLLILW